MEREKADPGRITDMPGVGTRCKSKEQTDRHVGLYGHKSNPMLVVVVVVVVVSPLLFTILGLFCGRLANKTP